jgi:cell division septation protein DedD
LEQQAKERLTGGVILVVLLVLLVPELLTGPRPAPPPTPAQPDQAPLRSYTMDLGESPHARAPVAASTTATTAPTATNATVATPAPAARAVVPSSAPEPAPLPPAASAPALSAHSGAPPPAQPPATEHATAWTVQLGLFSNRENATRLIASLKSHGFNPSMTDATKSGHKLYRVRVGNEHDRAAAQKLLARLKAVGVKGAQVVAR